MLYGSGMESSTLTSSANYFSIFIDMPSGLSFYGCGKTPELSIKSCISSLNESPNLAVSPMNVVQVRTFNIQDLYSVCWSGHSVFGSDESGVSSPIMPCMTVLCFPDGEIKERYDH